MISRIFKPAVTRFITPVARFALRIGISPNVVTWIGAIGVVSSALYFYPRGEFFVGSAMCAFFALSDLFDGAMARISKAGASRWGGFLDSTIDRITDSAILIGVLLFLIDDNQMLSILVLVALVTGLLVPYIRVKAESFGIECTGGIAERTERLVLSVSVIALDGLGVAYVLSVGMWVLAILGSITACQRMLIVKRAQI